MTSYVNEDAFFDWYAAETGRRDFNKSALLASVFDGYAATKSEDFVLPASETLSGAEARYRFRYDDIGCCGASTVFIYF